MLAVNNETSTYDLSKLVKHVAFRYQVFKL